MNLNNFWKIWIPLILILMLFPAYVLFNNLILNLTNLCLSFSPDFLLIGTYCNMEQPFIPGKNQKNVYYWSLSILVLRNLLLLIPIIFLIFKRIILFRFLFFFVVSFSVLDLFGILSYLIDQLTGFSSFFKLYLSHGNPYLLSRYLNLPRITIPLVSLSFLALGYIIVRKKIAKIDLKKDIVYVVSLSFLSLVSYYLIYNFLLSLYKYF